ncbi:MAG: ADP-glyceromanno-heptose 6-epimerase [Alphaproteobacteria bacterium]|nr:ADP-glyceromanno-heptose 6-epimerase [Alphaproteobacteria bacterium]
MIIVTGGAGFIGSNLLAALEDRGGADLVLCDFLGQDEKWRNVAKRDLADIVPPEDLFDFLDDQGGEVDAIFHMGARSSTLETDADLVIELNFRFTTALWDWCAANDTRLIYASSAATYGDGNLGFDDDGTPAALARLRPLNLYAWSKHLTDRRVARLVASDAPRPPQWVGLKFFNVYGPNEYHKGNARSMVPQIYEQIVDSGCTHLFRSYRDDIADGDQRRDFVWIDDCTDMTLWLYDHPEVSGLFNIGSGTAHSFADLANAVFAALGRDPQIDFVDMPEVLRGRYQYFTEARMARLRAAGYDRPATPLADGVARYVRDCLDTDDPYR